MYGSVFLTGATGFVGQAVLDKLISTGCNDVKALVRNPGKLKVDSKYVTIIEGDILKVNTYEKCLNGIDTVIHLIGIIRESYADGVTFDNLHYAATKNLVDISLKAGVQKFIYISSNGARADAVSSYHGTKYLAEQYLISSGLNYTILRPSIIYGPEDSFINMLGRIMKKNPLFFSIGSGNYLLQPVSVYEVSEIIAKVIDNEQANCRVFMICGNKVLTYTELLKLIMKILNIRRVIVPLPLILLYPAIFLLGRFKGFPITKDQLQMLIEGNICNDRAVFDMFGVESRDIEDTLKKYLC